MSSAPTITAVAPNLKAPFPAFGGKSRVAGEVWARLGDVRNYIEPFAFSAAVLLKRPGGVGPIETINDRNAFVANFWRAVACDPERVAHYADWPVDECDLHARHRWLVASSQANAMLRRVREDPEFFDAKIAGWWCWGACCWIGSGWCDETHRNSSSETRPDIEGQMVTARVSEQLPDLSGDGSSGRGVHAPSGHRSVKRAKLSGNGIGSGVHASPHECRPGMSQAGWGVNAGGVHDGTHRPQLADAFSRGRGVNGNDGASACQQRREWLETWMRALSDRLRPVRRCCGHWSRVCDSPSTMTRLGTTGVFLDPPYRIILGDGTKNRTRHIYANDRHQDVNALCDEVQEWCLRWGPDPDVRIALCGLAGEYPAIEAAGWEVFAWKSNGGYGNRKGGRTNENAHRERVWFSPHCLKTRTEDRGLFNGPSFTEAT